MQFTIEEKAMLHVRADTKAKLGSDGLIGNKIIALYRGAPSSLAIADGHVFGVEKAASTEEKITTLLTTKIYCKLQITLKL